MNVMHACSKLVSVCHGQLVICIRIACQADAVLLVRVLKILQVQSSEEVEKGMVCEHSCVSSCSQQMGLQVSAKPARVLLTFTLCVLLQADEKLWQAGCP